MLHFVCLKHGSLSIFLFLIFSSPVFSQINHFAEPEEGVGFTDDFKVLIENKPSITDFFTLSQNSNFNRAFANPAPWTDSYWPNYRGGIATRFVDPGTPKNKIWQTHYNFYLNNPASIYLSSQKVRQLSPAEKYDLLIGDTNWTLTKYVWSIGQGSQTQYGMVPTWTGICHGWAAASQIGIPAPKTGVKMMDVAQTTEIQFYPFDISALVSYLWSKPKAKDLFTGRRCRTSSPERHGSRVTTSSCFDVNPMTWHLAVTNRIGGMQKSLVMDTSQGSEVWNYVVYHYNTLYFNPATSEYSYNIVDSIVKLSNFPHDELKDFRGSRAVYIVGVMMDVFFPGAVSPHIGSMPTQNLERKKFVYDLELDENYQVVGGEWRGESHPDFLWIYPESNNPFLNPNTLAELYTASLDPLITTEVASRARKLSVKGKVLDEVVYKILQKSLGNRE